MHALSIADVLSKTRVVLVLGLACCGCAMYELPPVPAPAEPRPAIPAPVTAAPESSPELQTRHSEPAPVSAEDSGGTAAGTMPLSRDGSIATALANNTGLEVARFGPRIAATLPPEQRAAFDPGLTAMVSYGRQTEQLGGVTRYTFGAAGTGAGGAAGSVAAPTFSQTVQNALQVFNTAVQQREVPSALDAYNSNSEVRLSNYLPTGTTVFLSGGMSREETNFYSEQYTGRWSVGVNQALLEGRGRAVNLVALQQARNEQVASRYELERAVLELVALVERGYWDLVLAREVLSIRRFGVELAQEQLDLNQDLFDVGRAVKGDVLSAKAERASRVAGLHDAQGGVRTATVNLLRLLNPEGKPDWETRIHPSDPPKIAYVEVAPEVSGELARHYRPELTAQRLVAANRALDVVAARNALLPRLDLTAGYGRTSLGDSFGGGVVHLEDPDYDNYSIGLEFETPILNRGEKARHRRARLAENQAEAQIADLEQQIASEVRTAAIEVEKQWRRIEATEEAVASRQEELRIERDRYEAGRATNLDVLQVQRLLIEARVNAASARVKYIQALTALYAAEGTLLARRGVAVAADSAGDAADLVPAASAPRREGEV